MTSQKPTMDRIQVCQLHLNRLETFLARVDTDQMNGSEAVFYDSIDELRSAVNCLMVEVHAQRDIVRRGLRSSGDAIEDLDSQRSVGP